VQSVPVKKRMHQRMKESVQPSQPRGRRVKVAEGAAENAQRMRGVARERVESSAETAVAVARRSRKECGHERQKFTKSERCKRRCEAAPARSSQRRPSEFARGIHRVSAAESALLFER